MLIKICGMKEPGNVKEVAALHPDMLGFIFYKASPRYAGDLSPRALERLPAAIGKVGVCECRNRVYRKYSTKV